MQLHIGGFVDHLTAGGVAGDVEVFVILVWP